jgi:renal tumor antigen
VPHTEYISTRWYRPPECLLTDGFYDSKIDIWGLGCVLYEIIVLEPLFQGKDEMDQINKIHDVMGTPHPQVLAYYQQYVSVDQKTRIPHGLQL